MPKSSSSTVKQPSGAPAPPPPDCDPANHPKKTSTNPSTTTTEVPKKAPTIPSVTPNDMLVEVLKIAKNTLQPDEELHEDLQYQKKLWHGLNRLGVMPENIKKMKRAPALHFIQLYKVWLENFQKRNGDFPASGLTKARMLRDGYKPPFPPDLTQKEASAIIKRLEEPPENPTMEDMQRVIDLFDA